MCVYQCAQCETSPIAEEDEQEDDEISDAEAWEEGDSDVQSAATIQYADVESAAANADDEASTISVGPLHMLVTFETARATHNARRAVSSSA